MTLMSMSDLTLPFSTFSAHLGAVLTVTPFCLSSVEDRSPCPPPDHSPSYSVPAPGESHETWISGVYPFIFLLSSFVELLIEK